MRKIQTRTAKLIEIKTLIINLLILTSKTANLSKNVIKTVKQRNTITKSEKLR